MHCNASYNVPGITEVNRIFSKPLFTKTYNLLKSFNLDKNIFAGWVWAAGKPRTLVIKCFLMLFSDKIP